MTKISSRHALLMILLSTTLGACAGTADRELKDLDPRSMDDIMLNFADPTESVNFFSSELARDPNDVEVKRNMAGALARAERFDEAAGLYAEVVAGGGVKPQDRITYADVLLRTGNWKAAQAQLAKVPQSVRSYDRSRVAAILADIRHDWPAADRNYEQARSLTIEPAAILNNWGVSKLSRGAYPAAEEKFREAISFDRSLFAAKNNLVIARGRQRNYQLPIVPMTEVERAQLLHDLAVVALENEDNAVAKQLLREALDVHPQHFEAAASKLAAL